MDQFIRQVTAHQWTPESRCRSQKSRGLRLKSKLVGTSRVTDQFTDQLR